MGHKSIYFRSMPPTIKPELRQRELTIERLAAIVNGSDDAIITKDLNGIITSWNPGAQRIFGYTAEEAIGKSVTILIPQDHINEEPEILARIRRGEHINHYETVRRRKDGVLIDISLTVSPLRSAEGQIVGASKIARDITERKRQQEQNVLLLREMRHRVKNAFTVAQSIAGQTLTEISPQQLESFRSRLSALARVNDLLTEKNWQRTTLDAVVHLAIEPFQQTYGHRISVECPETAISPDLAQTLALVFHELATNAVKYGALSNKTGQVSIRCASDSSGAGRLLQWEETQGPVVAEPNQKGFGSKLLGRALIDHSQSLEFRPSGLYFSVTIPDLVGPSQ